MLFLGDESLAEFFKSFLYPESCFGATLRIVNQEAKLVKLLIAPLLDDVINLLSVLNKVCLIPNHYKAEQLVNASFTELLQPEFEIFQLKTNPV